MTLTFVLAGAPMGKQRIKIAQDGHAYTPERTVTFEGRLAYAAQQIMGDRPLLDGEIILDIVVCMPIPRSKPKAWQDAARSGKILPTKKPDFDNFSKIVDALNLIVWVDDAHVVKGTVAKFYSDKPCFAVKVRDPAPEDRVIPAWVTLSQPIEEDEGVFA